MSFIRNFRFTNWARNERSHPEKFFQPEAEAEIISIVKEAAQLKKRIRVVGAGHSWSPVACSDSYLINLDFYSKVLWVDKEKKRIRVRAGIRLKHLNKILEENGLALINLGSVSEQSVAGAISTGTHGTGINYGCLATQIISLRLIMADGTAADIDEHDLRLDALRVSMGMLGIISEVTIQCTDAFNLEETSYPMRFDEALNQLPELLKTTDHLKFWWFPHVEHLMVYRYQRTAKPAPSPSTTLKWVQEVLLAKYFFALLLRIGTSFPAWIPSINNFIRFLHLKKIKRVGKSCDVFNVPMPPRHRETEYAIPVEKAPDALRELREAIQQNGLKVNFVTEIRFVKGDAIWLSPAYKRDSCFIGGYLHGDNRWQQYMAVFESLMKKFDGRPHWGKEFTPELHDFGTLYERFSDFAILGRKLNPENRFSNDFTDKIFPEIK